MIKLAVLAGAAVAPSAFACEPLAEARFWVVPNADASPAPRNAHVFVVVETEWGSAPAVDPKSVRLVAHKKTKALAATVDAVASDKTVLVELKPAKSLAANAKFDVVAKLGGKRRVLATFATGAQDDTVAPTWSGLEARAFGAAKATGGGSCWSRRAGVRLVPVKAEDAGTKVENLLYLVRIEGSGAPRTFLKRADRQADPNFGSELGWRAGEIGIGGPYEGVGEQYGPAFEGGGKLTFTVTPLDHAGNRGAEKTVTTAVQKI